MEYGEIFKTNADCHLIVQDAVDGSGKDTQGNDLDRFHARSICDYTKAPYFFKDGSSAS